MTTKTYLLVGLIITLSHTLEAQDVSAVSEAPVPGAFTPATPPRSAEDVRLRVEKLRSQTNPLKEVMAAMERTSAAYEKQVIQALDGPVSEVDQKIDAARTDWVEGIGRESSRVEVALMPVLSTARGLSSWATVKLRTLEVTLNRRIRESERRGEKSVQLTSTELNDLQALDALDLEKEIEARETAISIDRLHRILLDLEADRDELQATAGRLEQVRSLYGGLGRGMRKAAGIAREDELHKGEAREFGKSVEVLRKAHDDAAEQLQKLIYQVNTLSVSPSPRIRGAQ